MSYLASVVTGVSFLLAAACAIASMRVYFAMIQAINRHPDQTSPISETLHFPGKHHDVKTRYRQLYPATQLLLLDRAATIGAVFCFVCFVVGVLTR